MANSPGHTTVSMEQPLLEGQRPSFGSQGSNGSRATPLLGLHEEADEGEPHSVFSHKNPVLHGHRSRNSSKAAASSPFTSPNMGSPLQLYADETGSGLFRFDTQQSGSVSLDAPLRGASSIPERRPPGAEPKEVELPTGGAALVHGFTFGMINFIVCVPTLISYAAIVFRNPDYNGDMPTLTKLFFLSSAVHQLIFTMVSSLPFAVGQVQDVGLIFLSQISTHTYVLANPTGDKELYPQALATVLVACAGATAITGAAVWLVGYLRLSGYVQLLPLPVVGGYLGYIGYFCLAAGASLGTGLTVEGFSTWLQFAVWDPELWSKLGLSLAFALFLFYVAYNVEHVAALPSVLVAAPILFFVALWALDVPIEDARETGWVPYPDPEPGAGWNCFALFNGFQGIVWSALPKQIPKVIGLVCVVCFGSVLDIAAIQAEQPKPLDFDGELRMIGAANVASGCSCGFTGSYIFSQTIFSQRQRVNSTMNGWVVAIGEFVLFFLPVDVLQFFPGFYIGGTMAFFGVDIMLDWLVHSKSKVNRSEYALLLLTFFFVMFMGVIEGCAAGVAGSAVLFIVVYGTTPAVEIRAGLGSTAMRSFDERAALLEMRHAILCLELKGFLFFGAALQLSDNLLRQVESSRVRWALLDFTQVMGLDSTSARALAKLIMGLRADGVRVVLCAVQHKEQTYKLLVENGAMPPQDDFDCGFAAMADNLDEALAVCERGVLVEAGFEQAGASIRLSMTSPGGTECVFEQDDMLTRLLREYFHPLALPVSAAAEGGTPDPVKPRSPVAEEDLRTLARAMRQQRVRPGQPLFTAGRLCDGFMLVVEGTAVNHVPAGATPAATGRFTFEPGSLMGDVDFFLEAPHSYSARAGPKGCAVAVLTRSAMAKLERDSPRAALLVQRMALRSVCLLTQATASIALRNFV